MPQSVARQLLVAGPGESGVPHVGQGRRDRLATAAARPRLEYMAAIHPAEPEDPTYLHRKTLLLALASPGIVGDDLVHDLLQAAYDRYRICAWCGNEARGAKEACAVLFRVSALYNLDDELREAIGLTIGCVESLRLERRLSDILLKREGLV